MGFEIKLDMQAIRSVHSDTVKAAESTMNQLHKDIVNSQTMPFDIGDMQNNDTFVVSTDDGARLVTESPQARRLYYHPEYHFRQGDNANAGGKWLEPYISGDKKDFVKDTFTELLKENTGL